MPWCYEDLCIQARLTPEAAAQLLPEHDGPGQASGEGAHETPRSPSLPAPLPMEGRLTSSQAAHGSASTPALADIIGV